MALAFSPGKQDTMEISKTTVVIVAAACATAGVAGGYVLTRPSAPVSAIAQEAISESAPVEHSEGLVLEDSVSAKQAAGGSRAVSPAPRRSGRPESAASTTPVPPPPSAPAAAPAPALPPVERPDPVETPGTATEVVAIAPAAIENSRSSEVVQHPIEPSGPELEELVIAADSVVGIQVETNVSSETAKIEDKVVARVTRDVKVADKIAIPAGSKIQGQVTLVERGGKMRERARLGVRFTSVVLADGTRLPIDTETIYRDGDSPARESTAKIGGSAIAGTIIGGLLGGAKGAAIGGAIGGGAGSAAVMAGGRNAATLPAGSQITVRLQEPATVTVER